MSSIKRVTKTCKGCGQPKYIFGHGYCDYCYKKNRGKGVLSTVREKKVAVKPIKRQTKPYSMTGELEVFEQIWEERPHFSQIAPHKPLLPKGHKLWINQFSHVLPKSIYGEFRLDKRNIILKTPEEHTLWENHKDKIQDPKTGEIFLPQWEWVINTAEVLRVEYYNKFHNQKHFKDNGKEN